MEPNDWAERYELVEKSPNGEGYALHATQGDQADFRAIAIEGEIDVYTSPMMRKKLIECIEALNSGATLVIELSEVIVEGNTISKGVSYIDATGLGTLVGTIKKCLGKNITMVMICEESCKASMALRISRLIDTFKPYKSRQEAIEEISQLQTASPR